MTCSGPHSLSVWHGLHSYCLPSFFLLLSEQSRAYYFLIPLECSHEVHQSCTSDPCGLSFLAPVGDGEAESLISHCHSQCQSPIAQQIAS